MWQKKLQSLCSEYELNDVYIGISSPPYEVAQEIVYISRNKIEAREEEILKEYEFEIQPDEQSIYLGVQKSAHEEYQYEDKSYISYMHGIYDPEGNCVAVFGADFLLEDVTENIRQSVIRSSVIIGFIFLAMLCILTVLLHFLIALPVCEVSRGMRLLVNGNTINAQKLPVRGESELSMMAQDFNTMTDKIMDYVQTMEYVNAAAQIQSGMLPAGQFENENLKIEACMIPARNVGGDFYDYFSLEDGRVCLVIADVSDKGISAALFMASAVTCIRYNAKLFSTPAQILKKVNDDIASHNPEQLFVTVFLAVYDPASRKLTYANAGHNPPYLLSAPGSADGRIRLLDHEPGLVIGLFENEEYVLYRLGFRWALTDEEYLRKTIESLKAMGFFDGEL